jgi:hypothetical protein
VGEGLEAAGGGNTYLVRRHSIALHGLNAADLP